MLSKKVVDSSKMEVRKAGNVKGAKGLKKKIDKVIKEKNLDSKRVYFHFGDPDKLKKESSMNKTIIAQELIKVARLLTAIEFPTDKALKKYLKDHPDADRRKHTVKKSPTKKPSDKQGPKSGVKKTLAEAKEVYGVGSGAKMIWKGKAHSAKETADVMKSVVPTYNDFKAKTVGQMIQGVGGKWSFGREHSPVLYHKFSGSKDSLKKLADKFVKQGKADEAFIKYKGETYSLNWGDYSRGSEERAVIEFDKLPDKISGELRLWWD